MKRILFINHSTSRTGAPLMLLYFLKWLKVEKGISFDVLSLDSGDLSDSFTEISNQHFFPEKKKGFFWRVLHHLKHKLITSDTDGFLHSKRLLSSIAKNDYGLIYANSVLSLPVGVFLKKHCASSKLLVHFHELNLTINQFCPNLESYKLDINYSIAASNKVKDNLISNWGFRDNSVKVVYEHSQIGNIGSKSTDDFIVGASGLVNWRKGPDFFIMVAQYVFKKLPDAPIKFQWVGRISKLNELIFQEDIKKLGLTDKVAFVGAKENPHDFFSEFDMFLMTSKEDPFPLVCIEVGMMGKPIICFEGATGTEEVLKTIDGAIVPYLDIAQMGEMVIKYFNNKDFKLETGQTIKEIFNEFTPEKQGEKLYNIIIDILGSSKNKFL